MSFEPILHGGSYTSAHVLAIKYEACRAFYHFRNNFNKFNNTGARMYLSHEIKIT